jgi:hypothetical protein
MPADPGLDQVMAAVRDIVRLKAIMAPYEGEEITVAEFLGRLDPELRAEVDGIVGRLGGWPGGPPA